MAERRIRWMRVFIVILLLMTLARAIMPETTGLVVQVSINDSSGDGGANERYANITVPGRYNFSVIFDYKIMFMGYEINETLVYPNDTFEIKYYWKALDEMDEDYAVFVHFTDDEGRILFQGDYYPAPRTSLWVTGEMYSESRIIKVPENAAGQDVDVRLGWWHPPSGKRLDTEKRDDIIFVGTIRVK